MQTALLFSLSCNSNILLQLSLSVCFVVGPQEQALSCGEQAWSEGRVGYSQDYSQVPPLPSGSNEGVMATPFNNHSDELPNLIELAQIALLLPLHTADCERTFSAQNLILTKLRNRLAPEISDKLLRIRIHGKGLKEHDFSKTLVIWHQQKKRFLKAGHSVSHKLTTGV